MEGVKHVPVMSNAEYWTNGISECEKWPLWRQWALIRSPEFSLSCIVSWLYLQEWILGLSCATRYWPRDQGTYLAYTWFIPKVIFYFFRPLVGKDYTVIAGDSGIGRVINVSSRCLCCLSVLEPSRMISLTTVTSVACNKTRFSGKMILSLDSLRSM